jgi:glycosyltransferase involved in cell wall biosynthesis
VYDASQTPSSVYQLRFMSSARNHIIILGPAHPLRGGLASYDERLAREWNAQGHQATIYTFSLQYPGFLFPGTTQYSSEPAPTDLSIKIKINSINPLNWMKVGRELKKLQPDIIIVRFWLPFMGPCLGTILRIAKKNKHTKVVCIADNVIPHEKRPGDKPFTKYFLKACDAFITMSEKVLSDLQLFVPHKPAKFVPHPLYDNFGTPVGKAAARAHLGISHDKRILLFFGFIRKYKGLDILLEAMKRLQAQTSNLKPLTSNLQLLIAGEFYEDEKPYHEQIAALGIADDLILKTSFIPDSEVKYYLCAADVVVQPYRNATQSGVTPLAYHFEKPMIVTNVGGLPALVPHEKAGLVCEPNAEALAAAITRYFELGENHFIPHLRAEKQKYSWARMVEAIQELAKG